MSCIFVNLNLVSLYNYNVIIIIFLTILCGGWTRQVANYHIGRSCSQVIVFLTGLGPSVLLWNSLYIISTCQVLWPRCNYVQWHLWVSMVILDSYHLSVRQIKLFIYYKIYICYQVLCDLRVNRVSYVKQELWWPSFPYYLFFSLPYTPILPSSVPLLPSIWTSSTIFFFSVAAR